MTERNWKEIIQECEESGKTIAQWCNEHQIAESIYYKHRLRIRKESDEGNELIEIPTIVNIPQKEETMHPVAIVTIRGMRIEFFNNASDVIIKSFMENIRNAI